MAAENTCISEERLLIKEALLMKEIFQEEFKKRAGTK